MKIVLEDEECLEYFIWKHKDYIDARIQKKIDVFFKNLKEEDCYEHTIMANDIKMSMAKDGEFKKKHKQG